MNTAPIVSRVWSFCTVLKDDGVSYGDYLEQLTYLIFLKMADEYAKPTYNRDVGITSGVDRQSLTDLDNLPEPDELAEEIIENLEAGLNSFREVLNTLGKTG